MNCHACKNLVYSGANYGRCTHPLHKGVRFVFKKDRKGKGSRTRPYNKTPCPDYCMITKCSTCAYWLRGSYHKDGATPSSKGKCAIGMRSQDGKACQLWDKRTRKTDRALKDGSLLHYSTPPGEIVDVSARPACTACINPAEKPAVQA